MPAYIKSLQLLQFPLSIKLGRGVTSLTSEKMVARSLYEELYCVRGKMENRIKEPPRHRLADGTSTGKMGEPTAIIFFLDHVRADASSAAWGPKGTVMETAPYQTIGLRLLKIGAAIKVTMRKVWICLSSGSV